MNVMTAASELPFCFVVHESARRVVHEVKGQCTRLSGLDAESASGCLAIASPKTAVHDAASSFPCLIGEYPRIAQRDASTDNGLRVM